MIPFLNDILETDKIRDIEYRNVEQLGFDAESAKIYYDIYCHCADGKDFIVEMQRSSQKYYRERMVFYSTYPIQHQGKFHRRTLLRYVELCLCRTPEVPEGASAEVCSRGEMGFCIQQYHESDGGSGRIV